jgi:hypothetical protein
MDDDETSQLLEILDTFPDRTLPQQAGKERLEHLITPGAQSEEPPEFALDGVLLVDDVEDPRRQRLARKRLTTDEGT